MEIQRIALKNLVLSRNNTRKDLASGQEDSDLENLAASIKKHGLMNPLTVRPAGRGKYEIVSGQRRYLAIMKLGMKEVDCIVRSTLNDSNATVLSLVENVHRADMKPIDKAIALQNLYQIYKSYSKVASETAWSESTIRKYIKLLDLPVELQERLSTAEGPAKVTAMSKLAHTFYGGEALEVYEKISGFKQSIQEEILSRSGGDISEIDNLVLEAQEGIFDTRVCGGRYGCEIIKDIVKGKMTQRVFFDLVEDISKSMSSNVKSEKLKSATKIFWKTLARK